MKSATSCCIWVACLAPRVSGRDEPRSARSVLPRPCRPHDGPPGGPRPGAGRAIPPSRRVRRARGRKVAVTHRTTGTLRGRGRGHFSARPFPRPGASGGRDGRAVDAGGARWRLRRSTRTGGIDTDHGATARAARSTAATSALSTTGVQGAAAEGSTRAPGAPAETCSRGARRERRLRRGAGSETASQEGGRIAIASTRTRTRRPPSISATSCAATHARALTPRSCAAPRRLHIATHPSVLRSAPQLNAAQRRHTLARHCRPHRW